MSVTSSASSLPGQSQLLQQYYVNLGYRQYDITFLYNSQGIVNAHAIVLQMKDTDTNKIVLHNNFSTLIFSIADHIKSPYISPFPFTFEMEPLVQLKILISATMTFELLTLPNTISIIALSEQGCKMFANLEPLQPPYNLLIMAPYHVISLCILPLQLILRFEFHNWATLERMADITCPLGRDRKDYVGQGER